MIRQILKGVAAVAAFLGFGFVIDRINLFVTLLEVFLALCVNGWAIVNEIWNFFSPYCFSKDATYTFGVTDVGIVIVLQLPIYILVTLLTSILQMNWTGDRYKMMLKLAILRGIFMVATILGILIVGWPKGCLSSCGERVHFPEKLFFYGQLISIGILGQVVCRSGVKLNVWSQEVFHLIVEAFVFAILSTCTCCAIMYLLSIAVHFVQLLIALMIKSCKTTGAIDVAKIRLRSRAVGMLELIEMTVMFSIAVLIISHCFDGTLMNLGFYCVAQVSACLVLGITDAFYAVNWMEPTTIVGHKHWQRQSRLLPGY